MTITRIAKDNYIVTCCNYEFSVTKCSDCKHWVVQNTDMLICKSCDDLSEAIDYIDFIMLV